MSGDDHSTAHILQSLAANTVIAIAKGIGAAYTGSGAMLAETIHSGADCVNQILLLLGVKRAALPPDETHPLGYGRDLYFWSFIVALLLFSGGGVFSIYEGIHKLQDQHPPENVAIAIGILAFSLLIEGGATFANIKELNRRRGEIPFRKYLRETKDSDLVVIFGENSAATLGLLLALIAMIVSYITHDPLWDALGTLSIGLVLIGVSFFLAVEIKALLIGESADPAIIQHAKEVAAADPNIQEIINIISVQQGPGEALVAVKVHMSDSLGSAREVSEAINAFERALKAKHSEIKWCFVEPDLLEHKGDHLHRDDDHDDHGDEDEAH